MSEPIRMTLPADREKLAELRIGQEVRLTGAVFTSRDAGERMLAALRETGELPFGLAGRVIFYAGPTPPAAGRPLGSVGPTTASRMDFATPELMDAGLAACIGKGKRSQAVIDACVRNRCVYFAAVGGIAALLVKHVTESETVAWDDLGTEALRRIALIDFPVFVAVDSQGGRPLSGNRVGRAAVKPRIRENARLKLQGPGARSIAAAPGLSPELPLQPACARCQAAQDEVVDRRLRARPLLRARIDTAAHRGEAPARLEVQKIGKLPLA